MMAMRILIVEDEGAIAENLYDFLEMRGHHCDFAHSLATARHVCEQSAFDVIVLDRNLPDGDGAQWAKQLRAAGKTLPILMLTARATLDDKLDGFAAGADDYLCKPFALQEVEVRLLSLHRRAAGQPATGACVLGPLHYDADACTMSLNGLPMALPPKALRLLSLLMAQPARVVSREALEVAIWGEAQASSDNLRSLLHTVRKALGTSSGVTVHNVHGQGYKVIYEE